MIRCTASFNGYWGRLTAIYECESKKSVVVLYEGKIHRFANMIGMGDQTESKYNELRDVLSDWKVLGLEIEDFIKISKEIESNSAHELTVSRMFNVISRQ